MQTGVWLRALRRDLGLSQRALAGRLGITRQAVSQWERGIYDLPRERIRMVCAELKTEAPLEEPSSRPPRRGRACRRRFRPRYPIRAPEKQMRVLEKLDPGVRRRARQGLSRQRYEEILRSFPRDTGYELMVIHQLLAAGFRPATMAPLDLRFPWFAYDDNDFTYAGDRLQPALVLRTAEERFVVFGQVGLYVPLQERYYRVDFLVFYQQRGKRGNWIYVEIDGGYHEDTAYQDARRAAGLLMPELRYENYAVGTAFLMPRFLEDVLQKMTEARRRWLKRRREARRLAMKRAKEAAAPGTWGKYT